MDMAKIEDLREQVQKAYEGEFMQPEWLHGYWIEATNGDYTEWYPQSCQDLVPEGWEFEIIQGWGARLSAAGYLDCTEWSVYETEQGCLEGLLELAES